jgi:DnaJ like chaperone protein
VLGVSPDASDEEVRHAYREKVKHLHPDTLRSKGLPDEVIATINDQMSRINAAWESVKRERSL